MTSSSALENIMITLLFIITLLDSLYIVSSFSATPSNSGSSRSSNRSNSNNNDNSGKEGPTITNHKHTTLPYPFRRFTFAPNNVCTNPKTFYCYYPNDQDDGSKEDKQNNDDNELEQEQISKTTAPRSISSSQHTRPNILQFSMKNVPGNGDCMFLAVALATSTSMGLGGNDAFLNAIANETRDVVAQILSTPHGHLHVNGKRIVRVRDLLQSAANSEGVSMESYIELLRNGTLQGGGPELTVLSNVLRRPISIYELDDECNQNADNDDDNNSNNDGANYSRGAIPSKCKIKCVGSFGDLFKDPCSDLPEPAILSPGLMPGAYSWHIHVLVVEAGPGEKHACALLPKFCYVI